MKRFRLSKKWFAVFVTSIIMILLFAVAYALTPLDTFNSTTQISDVDATACSSAATPGTDMIGGERDILVARTVGAGTVVARANSTQPGKLGFAVGPGTTGSVLVQWDGVDGGCGLNATGLAPLSLNPDDGLALFLEQIDLGATLTMRVYTDAANFSTLDYAIPSGIAAPGQILYFPFEDFVTGAGAGATYTNVGAIELLAVGSSIGMVVDFVNSDLTRDFGDLSAAYNNITTFANNGARHIVEDVYFGTAIDADSDGQTSPNATGDNTNGTNDEDGLSAVTGSDWGDGGGQISMTTVVPAADTVACVVGWIDWNGNGSFDTGGTTGGVSELVHNNSATNGASTLNITTPTLANYTGTYPAALNARFRIFERNADLFTTLGLTLDGAGCPTGETEANMLLLLNGMARNGEVEDYQWEFSPTAVTLQAISGNDQSAGIPFVLAALGLIIVSIGLVVTRKRKMAR